MECEFPVVNENIDEIKEIFESIKTIAVIGLSPKEEKDSNKVAKYLQSAGYKIIPVYPKEEKILGEKVYRSLDDIKERVDMVDMFRKPSFAENIVDSIENPNLNPKCNFSLQKIIPKFSYTASLKSTFS